jgi:capsular exopolysaccharide synthesis family protein
VLVSGFGAFLYLRYTPPVYRSRAVLQLSEDDNANRILDVSGVGYDNKPEAKVELLRSKLLVSKTIENLPMRVSYFAKGQILTYEHYVASPYQVKLLELLNPGIQDVPVYISFTGLSTFDLRYLGQSFTGFEVGQEAQTPDFKILVAISDRENLDITNEEYKLYFTINSAQRLINRFTEDMDIRILSHTAGTIEISFDDNNPMIARDFTRAHASEFFNSDLEKRRMSDDNVLTFLNAQIDTVFNRLKESEVLLNQYKQDNKISNPEKVSDIYLGRMDHMENEIIQLQIEERLLTEVEKLAKKSSDEIEIYNLIPLVAGSKYETSLSKMLNRLQDLIVDREEALYRVKTDHTQIKAIDYQIGVHKDLIVQTIQSLKEQIKQRSEELGSQIQQTEGVYYDMPRKELEFARLQRLFTINDKYYTLLLEKSIEYRISKEGYVSNNQLLEEPRTPVLPVSPNKNIIWPTFIFTGLLIGFLIIAVRYLLHNKITSMNEIVKVSDATISSLGIVPKYKEDIPVSMLLVDKSPRSLIAESFRSIRTNLQFLDKGQGPKVAAITSTISGEGKTFVALNLAGIVAFGGKRVVVCDLDMRKPKIHKGFSVENMEGMSTLLVGRGTIDQAIRKSQLDNLDFITAGPIPPNPSELIINGRLNELLAELKKRYDFIVLDTPPAGLVTDAIALLLLADYPLYIFRSDYSKKQFVQVADKLINENKINLSVILNGVDMDRNKYSYKYSYGYGYGYGYGSGGYYEESRAAVKKGGFLRSFFKKEK